MVATALPTHLARSAYRGGRAPRRGVLPAAGREGPHPQARGQALRAGAGVARGPGDQRQWRVPPVTGGANGGPFSLVSRERRSADEANITCDRVAESFMAERADTLMFRDYTIFRPGGSRPGLPSPHLHTMPIR